MSLLVTVEALDLGNIFHFFFDGVGVSTHGVSIRCRRVVAITSLVILAPKTSLVLVFLATVALVGRRLLVLATRRISKRDVSRLNLFKVFFLLLGGLIPLKTPEVNLLGLCRWL